jgi:hypothetical protein
MAPTSMIKVINLRVHATSLASIAGARARASAVWQCRPGLQAERTTWKGWWCRIVRPNAASFLQSRIARQKVRHRDRGGSPEASCTTRLRSVACNRRQWQSPRLQCSSVRRESSNELLSQLGWDGWRQPVSDDGARASGR